MLYQTPRLFRSPDADTTAPPPAAATNIERGIPKDIDDLLYVASNVAEKWTLSPEITMVSVSSAVFTNQVAAAKADHAQRKQDGANRSIYTGQLKALDAQADEGVAKVKAYLIGKYEDEDVAKTYYGICGIVKEGANYRLPFDRQDRLANLDLMISGIAAEGFGTKPYGTDFWTTLKTNYTNALSAAGDTDSEVSGGIATVDPLLDKIRKTLLGLRFVLRGNYLDTYQQVWREWGYQAEDN